ncbi:MAG: hypothetical protein K6U14_11265 [Firmicutes bacterium]|nr:hypothetical protein [Alicyclobacillaceae bacterium]MCL6498192.1 hypothetical protein [Bacillota bacterium]
MPLSDRELERYSRQILLPEIDDRGQERLLQSRVAVRGPAWAAVLLSQYLEAAGVTVETHREPETHPAPLTVEGGGRRWQASVPAGTGAAMVAVGYLGTAVLLDLARGGESA